MKTADQYKLFARLFLLELDQATQDMLAQDPRFASALPENLQVGDPESARRIREAHSEFTRLFMLSVYPYASVFLDDEVIMNSDSTAQVERFYEAIGFQLKREWMVGAPDALGAELACAAWLLEHDDERPPRDFISRYLLPWAPICCYAIERNAYLEFYRVLARLARGFLLSQAEELCETEPHTLLEASDEQERDLSWVINYLLTPARSGIFLSKDDLRQIGAAYGIPISFGDRGLMLMSLLRGASLQDCLYDILESLQQIVAQWRQSYAEWTRDYPRANARYDVWSRRVSSTQKLIEEMRHTLVQSETKAELQTIESS